VWFVIERLGSVEEKRAKLLTTNLFGHGGKYCDTTKVVGLIYKR
jgi:hypothetical protein